MNDSLEPAARAADEVEVTGPSWYRRLSLSVDEGWPQLKYLSFGFIYAWIWLCYSSGQLGLRAGDMAGDAVFGMYMTSTPAVALVFFVAYMLDRRFQVLVENHLFEVALALLASVATLGVFLHSFDPSGPVFLSSSILTGMTTCLITLRIGVLYARVDVRDSAQYTFASFFVASITYFTVISLPDSMALALTALLPIIAVLATVLTVDNHVAQDEPPIRRTKLPSKGFFVRFAVAILAFSTITGLTRGASIVGSPVSNLSDVGTLTVLGTGMLALVLFFVVNAFGADFDISRLYYPIIILAVAGELVTPIAGHGPISEMIIGIAYNCFSMTMWCLISYVAHMMRTSPAKWVALGRGTSALGTTLGWGAGAMLLSNPSIHQYESAISVVLVLVLLLVALVVFNDQAIGAVLRTVGSQQEEEGRTVSLAEISKALDDGEERKRAEGAERSGAEGADGGADGVEGAVGEAQEEFPGGFAALEEILNRSCRKTAELYELSPRELEILYLLVRGRTIDFIANELVISFNTAKSHIRHVYVKTGVHTRQELLSLVEQQG